jgi:anthranilate 1,2-dioxygenase ferredoxin component
MALEVMDETSFYAAARLCEFVDARPLRKEVNGWSLLIVRDGDEIHAFHNLCTHVRVHMNAACVEGGAIVCPNHRARFDLRTGRCLGSPLPGIRDNLAPLTRFETRLVADGVEVRVPRAPPERG